MPNPPTHITRLAQYAVLAGFVIQALVYVWWMSGFAATTNASLHALDRRVAQTEDVPVRLASLEARVVLSNQLLIDLVTQSQNQVVRCTTKAKK